MARIAFCLPALRGHVGAHQALGVALANRGHEVVFVGTNGLESYAYEAGFRFQSLDFQEMDITKASLLRTLRATTQTTRIWIENAPDRLAKLAPDLVIIDQVEPGAALAACAAGLRYASLAAALPLDRDENIPPPYVPWDFVPNDRGRKRNRGGWRVADILMRGQAKALERGCIDHGLPLKTRVDEWISKSCDLRQLVPSLDFPHELSRGARPVGPLRHYEFQKTTGRDADPPLVFASLGSLQGGRRSLMRAIAGAAADLGVALYLAHGGGLSEKQCAKLPGAPNARAYHNQHEVLARATACITHAGMNTVLDCAAMQVPMLAIPLAFEQPAIAARLDYHGVARVLPPRKANRANIRKALEAILFDPRYAQALAYPADEIAAAGGVENAANDIEGLLPKHLQKRRETRTAAQ